MIEYQTYVIHVAGETNRYEIISNELIKQNLTAEYILEGNKSDITPTFLEKYFKGGMAEIKSETSCALKHILAYERLIESGSEFALILEDDIQLYDNFIMLLNKSIVEIRNKKLKNVFVSFEESGLRYVKGSERKKDTILYKMPTGRMAGAYLIDVDFAKSITEFIATNKVDTTIDFFHNHCSEKGIINIYWTHPTSACQRSINGRLKSLIDNKKTGIIEQIGFELEKSYKKCLYYFR